MTKSKAHSLNILNISLLEQNLFSRLDSMKKGWKIIRKDTLFTPVHPKYKLCILIKSFFGQLSLWKLKGNKWN